MTHNRRCMSRGHWDASDSGEWHCIHESCACLPGPAEPSRAELRTAIIDTARAIIATDGGRAPFCEADAYDLAYYIVDARTGRPMI